MVVTQSIGPLNKAALGNIIAQRRPHLITRRVIGLTLLIGASLLLGCGQTGPLYLPDEEAPEEHVPKPAVPEQAPSQESEQPEQ